MPRRSPPADRIQHADIREYLTRRTKDYSARGKIRNNKGALVRATAFLSPRAQRTPSRIMFADGLTFDGVTAASLADMPREELVGYIPNFQNIRAGEEVRLFCTHDAVDTVVEVSRFVVTKEALVLVVRFPRSVLEAFGMSGYIDFRYELRNAVEEFTIVSPSSTLYVNLHATARYLPPPLVQGLVDGVVVPGSFSDGLVVDIPATEPASKGGNEIRVRIGEACFEPVILGKLEASLDPMMRFILAREDILRMASFHASQLFTVEASYSVEQYGALSVSTPTLVVFDLRTPPAND
ncbi:hypothetical protein [Luteibacter yeojuensis]|uniref:Uncharacterized protein n=1 Tax=Luteibacter yeojuensis TaxID=345309 RepID=A0A0F3KGZ8_9GAMM|nr:hypothetical protein [Luteibacter yeojuensis]KJV30426.1 hypothetical protein VI08_15060 [Luteibacter yeojuensis]